MKTKYMGIFSPILQEVKAKTLQIEATFSHEGRECNKEAHVLARFASTLPAGRHVWFLAPPEGLNLPVNVCDT
jgi:hypothetical protein